MPIHPNAKQCAYTKVDGVRCGGPAKDPSDYCFHHAGLKERFTKQTVSVPPFDDQNAIQVALMDVVNGLLSKRIDRGDAYTVLYALQIARSNLRGLTLVPPSPDVVAELVAAATEKAKAEGREEARRENGDYDENGEPISLAAILIKELRESANHVCPEKTGPEKVGSENSGSENAGQGYPVSGNAASRNTGSGNIGPENSGSEKMPNARSFAPLQKRSG